MTLTRITSDGITDAAIVNADINASAAIALTKLEGIAAGKIIVGNGSGVAAQVSVTGDISISDSGVVGITANSIVNADISGSAAIAASKIVAASTSGAGVVQLNDTATSTSTSQAATANALKADITQITAKIGYLVSGAMPSNVGKEIAKPSVEPKASVFTTMPYNTIETAVLSIAKKISR